MLLPILTFVGMGLVIALIVVLITAKSKASRYREAGTGVDERTLEEYGAPEKTLYTSTEFFSFHHHIEITDEEGNLAYDSTSKFFSIHDKTDVTRADGSHLAHIERKFFTLHQRHFVTMYDGTGFELSNELFHLIRDVINIDGLGWQIQGNILQMHFVLLDRAGQIIAAIGQKFFSIHDKYSVDIYQTQYEETVVAILVCLQHMIRDREASSASSSSSSSASSSASG